MKTRYVYLGRFAPFHLGHKRLLENIIGAHGSDMVLIMIGSSNAISKRTPYTYETREKMIKSVYPNLEVIPLPDSKPDLEYFDGSTNGAWLDSIEKLSKARNETFVFCGGSKDDLEVLSERFDVEVVVDRFAGKSMSATLVRQLIFDNKKKRLERMVDAQILDIVINQFIKI